MLRCVPIGWSSEGYRRNPSGIPARRPVRLPGRGKTTLPVLRQCCVLFGRYLALTLTIVVGLAASPVPAAADPPGPFGALVDAAAERLLIADPAAAVKWLHGGDIEDVAREDEVLAAVAETATARGIDPEYVRTVFRDQIDATEAVEYSRFAQWKLDPAGAPTSAPDLSESRARIDGLNVAMVDQLAAHWDLLHSPNCHSELSAAMDTVKTERRFDELYQQALEFATRAYCR